MTVKDELCREVWGAIKAKLACFFDQYNTSLNETQAVSAEYIGIRDMEQVRATTQAPEDQLKKMEAKANRLSMATCSSSADIVEMVESLRLSAMKGYFTDSIGHFIIGG